MERTKPGVLKLVNKALPHIYSTQKDIFLRTKAKDLLFDGNLINCTSKDFSAAALCSAMKKESTDFVEVEPKVYKFSLIGAVSFTFSLLDFLFMPFII